jgi:hypothetical protein
MGLIEEIDRAGYHIRDMRIVDSTGARVSGFGTSVFREVTGGRCDGRLVIYLFGLGWWFGTFLRHFQRIGTHD